ncbi:MAG TPA: tol-pal system protein YbgF [Myxococcaceae bacterium]|nr:tol-pal system protein YbgF [Myxococcaceae bacterium]
MKRLTIAACLAAVFAAACFYPASRGKALEDKAAQQEQELKDLEQKLAATLPKIDEKIDEVTKALESLDRVSHQSGADISVRLQKNVEELAALRGQVEIYLFKIAELEKALKKQDETVSELQGSDAGKVAAARHKFEELHKPADPKLYLALADSKLKEGDYLLGRQLYDDFMKKWPRDPLNGEAHFGRGETFYAEDKCREALAEYGKVIADYPKSQSTPNAYLRSGDCFGRLKMKDEARLALEELIKNYPRSDAAKEAKARLAALKKTKASSDKTKRSATTRKAQ